MNYSDLPDAELNVLIAELIEPKPVDPWRKTPVSAVWRKFYGNGTDPTEGGWEARDIMNEFSARELAIAFLESKGAGDE